MKRSGKIAFRNGCILSVLRHYELGADLASARSIEAFDEDTRTGIEMARIYLRHAFTTAETLPSSAGPRLPQDDREVLAHLEPGFEVPASAIYALIRSTGATQRTATRKLRRWEAMGLVERVRHGAYRRMADGVPSRPARGAHPDTRLNSPETIEGEIARMSNVHSVHIDHLEAGKGGQMVDMDNMDRLDTWTFVQTPPDQAPDGDQTGTIDDADVPPSPLPGGPDDWGELPEGWEEVIF